MRITFLKDGGWGNAGGDKVIAIHADNLAKLGHTVHILSRPKRPPSFLRRSLDAFSKRSAHEDENGDIYHSSEHFSKSLLSSYRFPVDADLPDADVLISTWFETTEWVDRLSPSKGRHVNFIQGYETFSFISLERLNAAWELDCPKIVVSNFLRDLAVDKFDAKDVKVVPNSVDRSVFFSQQRGKREKPTVGFLAHSLAEKGTNLCMLAINEISTKYENLDVVTFGFAKPVGELPANVHHRHFGAATPEEAKNVYESCDVWLNASSCEGFGLTVLEALACGTPVVSSSVGAVPELIQEGKNGHVISRIDVKDLARLTDEVLKKNEATWRSMSANARSTWSDYTWWDASKKFEGALLSLCTEG